MKKESDDKTIERSGLVSPVRRRPPLEQFRLCEHLKEVGDAFPLNHDYPEECRHTVCQFCRDGEKECVLCGKSIKEKEPRVYDGDAPCHPSCYDECFGGKNADGA